MPNDNEGVVYTNPPQSRNEAILESMLTGDPYEAPPQSRIEDLLIQIKEAGGTAGTAVIANPNITGDADYVDTIQIGAIKYVVSPLRFKTMPSEEVLLTLPAYKTFYVQGFYNERDGHGGYYMIGNYRSEEVARGGLKIGTSKVLIPFDAPNGRKSNVIDVCRLGVREFNQGEINFSSITLENTYAEINSNIIANLNAINYGSHLKFPEGRFFFKDPINLPHQSGISGTNVPNAMWSGFLSSANSPSGTALFFPWLTNGQYAINTDFGNIENLVIVGDPNTYKFHIDRTKTVSAPDQVVAETIAMDGETQIKCYGLKKSNFGYIKNVCVWNFYNGIYCTTANIYIHSVYCRSCHFGVNVGNDTKLIGVYGWDCHTLLRVRGSITSAIQLRIDSCVNVVNVLEGSGITIMDVDGDYCTEELIKIGGNDEWHNVRFNVFIGIHGRCNALKAYDSTQGESPDVRDLADTSGYGIIRVEPKATFTNNYIVIDLPGGANPFDGHEGEPTNYRTPTIIATYGNSSNTSLAGNQFEINGGSYIRTADDVKKNFQINTVSGRVTAGRVDVARGTFFIDGATVSTYAIAES